MSVLSATLALRAAVASLLPVTSVNKTSALAKVVPLASSLQMTPDTATYLVDVVTNAPPYGNNLYVFVTDLSTYWGAVTLLLELLAPLQWTAVTQTTLVGQGLTVTQASRSSYVTAPRWTTFALVTDLPGVTLGAAWTISLLPVPTAPTITTITVSNKAAAVAFTASAAVSPILSYTVSASATGQHLFATGPSSPLSVAGLCNGTSYAFTVAASNQVGPCWAISARPCWCRPRRPRRKPPLC